MAETTTTKAPEEEKVKGITNSFKKHKVAWSLGAVVGIVVIYFIIKGYSGGNTPANNSANTTPIGTNSAGVDPNLSGTTGIQGPAGPKGAPGKRGPRGFRRRNHHPPPSHHRKDRIPPTNHMPNHTSGISMHPDQSHAIKSPIH